METAMNDTRYTTETITEIRTWTPTLFSFKTTRSAAFRFTAGQFARLGVAHADGVVWRAYSIVSGPYDEHLEFFSIVVPGGAFTSRLATLRAGDPIHIERRSLGFLTTDRFELGKDLWMLSTGTGLAPFLSILYDLRTWESWEDLVLVHSVRHRAELAYEEAIRGFRTHEVYSQFSARLHYVQAVTRETAPDALDARITDLLASGALERRVGLAIDRERSRVMICGNPDMVDDTRTLLSERGLRVSRRGDPGQLAVENYW